MSNRLRKGMWVRLADRVGIVANLGADGAEVHLTDADGATETVVVAAPSSIAQAAFDDIPEARRPSADVAASLGYL